jgi:hypothetical protein
VPYYFPGNTAKSFKVIYSNQQVSGYLMMCDSIKVNPTASRVGDIEIYSACLFKVNLNGSISERIKIADLSNDTSQVRIDYKSIDLTIENNTIINLFTFKDDLAKPEKPFIVALDMDFNQIWNQKYDLLDHNYANGKSIHYNSTSGSIIWSASILKPSGDFNDSYLAIPKVQEDNTFENFSQLGEGTSQYFLAREIQPARSIAFGYGVVGTRALTSGEKSNMFFIRVDAQGNFIPSSEKYFDKILSQSGQNITFSDSDSQDNGESLTSTTDGGFALAGSTQQGSELRDVYVVKVDGTGNYLWSNTFGGVGDESASCIREDGNSLIIIGTNDLAGLSSLFLIKTDEDGSLSK